jgi:PAS domain S-box-containing protein
MMPRLDGFGLLTALRDDVETMHVPVIMFSARSEDDATVAGLEAGADDYLVKPFSARELLARVRANLELDRVRRVAEELARSRELLAQAEALAHVGSWEVDLADDTVTASRECFHILGVTDDTLSTRGMDLAMRFVHEDDLPMLRASIEATARDGTPLDAELRIVQPDGRERLVRTHGVLNRSADGVPVSLWGSIQDITDQRRAERAQAAAAANREAAAREHAIAEELQRSLLPALTFRADRIDVAAYYRAGVEGTQAGGDWYDVIDLDDGRTGLVLGDVMGRGVGAAAVMGQLRATVRAYARLNLPPAQLLGLLDDTVATIGSHTIVTCVYAVFDPSARTLTYGNAGHLPPLLSPPGAPTRALVAGDPPLGTGCYAGRVERVHVEPGTRLTLYTDGLVEHRDRGIEAGIEQLVAALDRIEVPVEGAPSMLVEALLPHEPDDDVAILSAVLGRRADAPPAVSVDVEPAPQGASAARAATELACAGWGVDESAAFDVSLIVSELITNAIRHGRPPIGLVLRREPESVIIDVSDAGDGKPQLGQAAPSAPTGRGLTLVDALAGQWGTRPTGRGKSVWCTVLTRR